MYSSAGPSVISIALLASLHVRLKYNDLVLKRETEEDSDLYGNQPSGLAWHSAFLSNMSKYTLVHRHDGSYYGIISTEFSRDSGCLFLPHLILWL